VTSKRPASRKRVDPNKGAVTVAYVHSNSVCYSWHHSLIELLAHDMSAEGRLMRGGWIAMRCGTDGLVEARNKGVQVFLKDRTAEWLLWLDTDAGFEPDLLERLVEAADPVERPVVGALAFSYREDNPDGMGGWRCRPTPTIFDWHRIDDAMGFVIRWGYPPNTLVRCAGTGSHAILIHRSVFERVAEKYGEVWYDRVDNTSTHSRVSEDLSFCMRVNTLQIPVYVHTGVRTSHQKTIWLSDEDFYGTVDAPPATVPTAVIVPAIRTSNVERFMSTLRASSGLARAYAVANVDEVDEAKVWREAGAEIIQTEGMTFAERMNAGYRNTSEPFVFMTGDDVRFRKGWLDQAQAVAGERFDVVGTNDLGNPRVIAGEHATHILLRRTYLDEVGASWDGPGSIAHEGYGHWYVDDEIVTAAKQRDTWAMAIDSHVEHLHPQWGKGPDDNIYRRGIATATADGALFAARRAAHGGDK
jgi:Glycosyl transferase family 2